MCTPFAKTSIHTSFPPSSRPLSETLYRHPAYRLPHSRHSHPLFLSFPFPSTSISGPISHLWLSLEIVLFCIIPTYMPLIFSDIPYSPFGTSGCGLGCSGSFLNMLALRNTLFSTLVNYLSSMILYFIFLRSFRWGLNLSFLPTAANRSAEI